MSPATMTTVDAILKEVQGPRIESQLQNEVTGLKRIERTSDGVTESVGGKYVDFPIKVKRNSGIGYRVEGGLLPAAGQQGFAEVHVPLKYGYGRVRYTGQLMTLAKTNEQAFANAVDLENNGLKDDLVKDSARIFYGDSSGLMASITDVTTGTSHTVDNAQYAEEGAKVDILTRSNGATVLLNTEIVSVTGLTVVTTGSYTGAVTAGIYRQGSYNNEPSGLDNIVDDASVLHTVNPATVAKWKAVEKTNGGVARPLSEGLMIETADAVRVNGGKLSVIFTSLGVRRAYFNLLVQQRNFSNTKEFAGGFTGLPFNYGTEIPVVEDVDHKPGSMHFLDESKFKIYRSREWHWMDDEGHVLKWVADYGSWEALMRCYWELGVSQRNAQAVLADIIEG